MNQPGSQLIMLWLKHWLTRLKLRRLGSKSVNLFLRIPISDFFFFSFFHTQIIKGTLPCAKWLIPSPNCFRVKLFLRDDEQWNRFPSISFSSIFCSRSRSPRHPVLNSSTPNVAAWKNKKNKMTSPSCETVMRKPSLSSGPDNVVA